MIMIMLKGQTKILDVSAKDDISNHKDCVDAEQIKFACNALVETESDDHDVY